MRYVIWCVGVRKTEGRFDEAGCGVVEEHRVPGNP